MLSAELMRQFRRLQWRARRLVQTMLEGQYHSAFRGTGLSFEEVREYQPGDEVRAIDWNVTARTAVPHVKRFVEERELNVMLVADLSGSLRFGSGLQSKRRVLGELAALISLSAISNGDRVGLIAGGAAVERYLRPAKGLTHTLRLLRDILYFEPGRPGTSLAGLLEFLNRTQRKRAIVFFISDFLDGGFDRPFRAAGRFHDFIALKVGDPRERELPAVGLVQFEDAETGRQRLIDTAKRSLRDGFARRAVGRDAALRKLARSAAADLIEVPGGGDHLDALVRFFRLRRSRR